MVLGYVEGTVFAVPGKASQQNTGDTSLGPEPPPEDQPSPAAGKSQGPRAHRGPRIVRRETGVFKNGTGTGRHTHTHIQKGEIRLVPHTTYEN